ADAATVRAAVLADLVPDEVRLVGEPPALHRGQGLGEQGVGTPEIEVALRQGEVADRQGGDFPTAPRRGAAQATVLGGHLAGAVQESPGRVDEDGAVAAGQAGEE